MNGEERVAFIKSVEEALPDMAFKSSVAIVGSYSGVIRHRGSGTLFAIADRYFLVTARHVVMSIHDDNASLGFAALGTDTFISACENWTLSNEGAHLGGSDVYDIAICSLVPAQIQKLSRCEFLRLADVSFNLELDNGYFAVIGYPSLWATTSVSNEDIMSLQPLQYSTFAYQGNTSALIDYHPKFHFLVHARPEQVIDSSGEPIRFRTLTGHVAQLPRDLQGISGCGVWMIGDIGIACDRWGTASAKLVGVETGIYEASSAIKISRWSTVITLIHAALPDLRPAIELYRED